MSCREHPNTDWRALVAERDQRGEDPAGWDEAVARLDACGDCRKQALMADPSLVFRRLPRVETGPADVESMRQAVASLRRASRVTAVDESGPGMDNESGATGAGGGSHRVGLRRLAAAALLAAAGLAAWIAGPAVLDPAVADGGDESPAAVAAAEGAASLAPASGFSGGVPVDGFLPPSSDLGGFPVASRLSAEDLASRPVFEGLSQPSAADVYQVGEEDLLVVMVVDETLDI